MGAGLDSTPSEDEVRHRLESTDHPHWGAVLRIRKFSSNERLGQETGSRFAPRPFAIPARRAAARPVPSAGPPVLQQARALVQRARDLTAGQVEMGTNADGEEVIQEVHLPSKGRPEGAISGEEGNHTTAWSAFAEGLRQALLNKTMRQAVREMDRLAQDAFNLPGAQPRRVEALSQERQGRFNEAMERLLALQQEAWRGGGIDTLQRYIGAYLAFRNLVPFSTVKRGAPSNVGRESRAIATLRLYETKSKAEIRGAIYAMLDKSALESLYDDEEHSFEPDPNDEDAMIDPWSPGVRMDDTRHTRVITAVRQHLQTMQSLFPFAYEKAEITEDRFLNEYLFPRDDEGEIDFGERGGFQEKMGVQSSSLPMGVNPLRRPTMPAATSSGFAVRLDLRGDDRRAVVEDLDVGGRPRGLFGAADKKHSTAWATFVAGVRNRITGLSLGHAANQVQALIAEAQALPGAQQVEFMPDDTQASYGAALAATVAAGQTFDTAWRNDHATVNVLQAALQGYVRAYLCYRNLVPLTAAHLASEVSTSGGKGEPARLAILDGIETRIGMAQRPDNLEAGVRAFWELLDFGVVREAHAAALDGDSRRTATGRPYDRNLPGVSLFAPPAKRVCDLLVQHIKSMRSSYPRAVRAMNELIRRSIPGTLDGLIAGDQMLRAIEYVIVQSGV
jgi:hypothetical protein